MKKINIAKTESVEWTWEANVGSDEIVGTIAYTDDFEGWLSRCPEFESLHPDYAALTLKKKSASRIEGGQIRVTLEYKSREPTEEEDEEEDLQPIKRYSIEIPTSEEPLLTNHIFSGLSDSFKEALQELMNSSKTPEDFAKANKTVGADAVAQKAIAKIRKGTDSFLNPGIVWVEKFTTKDVSTIQLSEVGNIMDAPGSPPGIGTRTWLYLGATGDMNEDGKTWDIERRWQASERGGWDEDLYSAESE